MSFLEKNLFSKKEAKAESKGSAAIETGKTKLNPLIEHKIHKINQDYDGNEAFKREQWLKSTDLNTIKLLSDLHKKDKNKYSDENIAQVLSTLDDFKSNHDFDIKYVSGRLKKTRLNLFPPTIREQIISDIISGKLRNDDENYFEKIIQGGKEYLEKIKYTTKRDREMRLASERNRQARVSEYMKNEGKDQEIITTECPTLIIETHADREFSNSALEDVDGKLPPEIDRRLLRINYQEGVSAVDEHQDNEPQNYNEITDRSGEIGEDFLKHVIKNGEKTNIILTGGNLRGCLSSSIESIANFIEKNKPEQIDMNILLDKTYDNDSYDEKGKLPTDLLRSRHKLFVEIYKDGNLIDVSSPNPDKEQTRIRLFLWSRSENLFSKQKDSIGIKKIRESISKI